MSVTKDEADAALHDINKAGEQSLTLFHYGIASPYLLLWGALWIVAGIIGTIAPENVGIVWLIVNLTGIVATGYLAASNVRRYAEDDIQREGLRYIATILVLTGFITMTFVVFSPVSAVEIQTFITILIASIYMVFGLWTGNRLSVIGGVLAVLVVSAFFYTPARLPLMVSILGGGALILGGLWMRRA